MARTATRTWAIGDVHGCADALNALLDRLRLRAVDRVVFLGDLIDRGPDSRQVVESVMALRQRCEVVLLRGNHEQLLLDAVDSSEADAIWRFNGGEETLRSYAVSSAAEVPADHRAFLAEGLLTFEMDEEFCLHGNYQENKPLGEQDPEVVLWRHLDDGMPGRHVSGKTAVVGHTPMIGEVFDLGHLVCLDTGCCMGGLLTAMDLATREFCQVDVTGEPVAG